jgi:hypothetical protein
LAGVFPESGWVAVFVGRGPQTIFKALAFVFSDASLGLVEIVPAKEDFVGIDAIGGGRDIALVAWLANGDDRWPLWFGRGLLLEERELRVGLAD